MAHPYPMPRYIVALGACEDPAQVGGKAAWLAQLIRSGFHVPPGLCLTAAFYRDALRAAGLDDEQHWRHLHHAAASERRHRLDEFRRAIESLMLPRDLQDQLDTALDGLASPPAHETLWAVRSSAISEDSAKASSAGLYRTILGVPRQSLPSAVIRCWAALWTPHALDYHTRAGWPESIPQMAVLIQPVLSPRTAGVAYSCHPLSSRPDLVVINAMYGLAEPLLGGRVTPDQYVVQVTDTHSPVMIERQLSQKTTERLATTDGLVDRAVHAERQSTPALEDREVFTLARFAKTVEHCLGYPADIEWAIDSHRLWLLQARPISRLTIPPLTQHTCVWSRANLKETLPELPSPLGLSVLEQFMENQMLHHYRALDCSIPPDLPSVRVISGRPYINVTLFESLMTQLGGDPALVAEQMGGPAHPVLAGPRRLPIWKLIRAGILIEWKIRAAPRRAPTWFQEITRMAAQAESATTPADVLARLDSMGHRLRDEDLTFAIIAGVSQGLRVLRFLLERPLAADWRSLLNAALQGVGGIISVKQILWLGELAERAREEPRAHAFFAAAFAPDTFRAKLAGTRFLQEFDKFLEEYGHRAVGESDAMSPRFAENPAYLLNIIRGHVQALPSQAMQATLQRQALARRAALKEIRRRLGWRLPVWLLFRWGYRRLGRYLSLREANRHHLMYLSAALRRLVLNLGEQSVAAGRIASKDDLFFLKIEEIRALALGEPEDWQALIAARRQKREQHAAVTVPDLLAPAGSVSAIAVRPDAGMLSGIPINTGYAEGPVRLLHSPDDVSSVQKGDILVVSVIDPGMVPIFGLAAGLIAEMGGTLSHGAIIVREYGLPAVINVPQATRVLTDGERVALDAGTGMIQRLEAKSH